MGLILHVAVKCKTCQQAETSCYQSCAPLEVALKMCGWELVDNMWECRECVEIRVLGRPSHVALRECREGVEERKKK